MKHKLITVLARSAGSCTLGIAFLANSASAQQALTWDQVKAKFEAVNPVLKADAANVEEMKAEEITAFLRPNPQFTISADGTQIAPHNGVWTPFKGTTEQPNFSYLHERERKRELRLESAKEGTQISQSQHADLERNLIFGLRSAFVQTLQAKAVLALAKADLEYYDKIIDISRARFNAGDLAKIDLARIELQRVQYESEIETAIVNLRQQKIQLLLLLDDRTPVDQFDVTGLFDLGPDLQPLGDYHRLRWITGRICGRRSRRFSNRRPITNSPSPMVPPIRHSARGTRTTPRPITRTASRLSASALVSRCGSSIRTRARKKRTLIDIDRSQHAAEAAQGAGLQRRGQCLRIGAQQYCADQAVQGAVSRPVGLRARHRNICLSARRSIADGLSQCAERLPRGSTGVSATDRRLYDGRWSNESCRGT